MIGRCGLALALMAVALFATTQGAGADEPLKLRIGWAVVPGQLTAVLFEKHGLSQALWQSPTPSKLIHFRGSTPQITALAAGELDLAALAFSSFGLAIQNAHMDDLRAHR